MFLPKKFLIVSIICLCLGMSFWVFSKSKQVNPIDQTISIKTDSQTSSTTESNTKASTSSSETPNQPASLFTEPISDTAKRITKKHFGTYVEPGNSPVSPERFKGFHTGLDIETFPEEENQDIEVKAICTGELRQKQTINGYGGVAIQDCLFKNKPITILYGHLKFASIKSPIKKTIQAGETIGLLGKGFSTETSNERKHLHLSIHQGITIDVRGYVASKNQLDTWLDPEKILGLSN